MQCRSDKGRDGLRTIALEELLEPVAVLCDEIQQRVNRDAIEKPSRNSGSASEHLAKRASIPAPVRSIHIIKFNINSILRNTQRRLN